MPLFVLYKEPVNKTLIYKGLRSKGGDRHGYNSAPNKCQVMWRGIAMCL